MKPVPHLYVAKMKPPQGGKAVSVGNWKDTIATAKQFLEIGATKVTITKLVVWKQRKA